MSQSCSTVSRFRARLFLNANCPAARFLWLFLVGTGCFPLSTGAQTHVSAPTSLTAEALFAPAHIVEIDIEVDPKDWDTLRKQRRDFIDSFIRESPPDSPFTYVKADVTIDGQQIKGVGLRKKGFLGSLHERRPSLKIKFSEFHSEYKSNPPIRGLDRLTLNNNNQDPAGASHLLGYQIFRDSGTRACRCNTAHVKVNGKDLGIYSHVESIRKPFLKRTFEDASGGLFEGTVTDFYPGFVNRFDRKNSAADLRTLSKLSAILDADELDLDELQSILDVDAFILYWATESLIGFWDGYTNDQNNFFMYQDPGNSKLYFLPWGVDCAFSENMPLPPFVIRPQFVYTRSRLANQLYRNENTRQKYILQVEQLLKEHWDEDALLADVDALEDRVRPLNTRGDDFDKSLKRVRRFIKTRRAKLTREIEEGFTLKQAERKLPHSAKIAEAQGSFDAKWFTTAPDNGKDLGSHQLAVKINEEEVAFRKLGVYAYQPTKSRKPPRLEFYGNFKNGKQVSLTLDIPSDKWIASEGKPVEVTGMLVRGKRGWIGTTYKRLSGTVTFEQAGQEEGDRIRGSIDLIARELIDPNWQ